MDQPHAWLGREFRTLLPEIRSRQSAVRLAVTRPSGRSYGEGALRVLRVRGEDDALELLLAYERYQPPYFQKGRQGKRGRS